jgi:predicted PurR-regulated permease PerM
MTNDIFGPLQKAFFFGALIAVTALFGYVLFPFVMSIFWAMVFALILYPLFSYLKRRMGRPSLSALLTMLIALIVLCVPLYFLGQLALGEGIDLYQRLAHGGIDQHRILENPLVARVLDASGVTAEEASTKLAAWAQGVSGTVFASALTIGAATLSTALQIGVMLYLLFFFLRDGAALTQYLHRLIPLGDAKERLLFARFASTVRAVFKGTLIVALVQGLIGGILFMIAGINSAVLWGAVMAFCATIPAIGPFIVWLPAGLILLAGGFVWQGVLVLLGGAFIIGTVDNVLRPILVGRDIEMPDALVLLSILGGIAGFGIAGVIIGPVFAALFLSIWNIFGEDFSKELSERG